MMTYLCIQIPVPVRACASMHTDPNMHTGMSITGNGNLSVLVPTFTCRGRLRDVSVALLSVDKILLKKKQVSSSYAVMPSEEASDGFGWCEA
jgi:hypothetical protein